MTVIALTNPGHAGTYAEETTGVVGVSLFDDLRSVSFWVSMDAALDDGAVLIEFADPDADTPRLAVTSAGGGSFLVAITGATTTNTGECSIPADGDWHQLIISVDTGSGATIYVDGEEADTIAVEESYAGDVTLLTVLNDQTHTHPAAASISALAVWDYPLSGSEAAAMYTAGTTFGVDIGPDFGADGTYIHAWIFGAVPPADGVAPDALGNAKPLSLFGWFAPTIRAFPVGTHSVRVIINTLDESGLMFESWAFDFATAGDADTFGEAPRVTGVTGTITDVTLLLDAAMQPGIGYTLTPPDVEDVGITGPRRSLARERSPDDRVLLDIDAPFIRPEGAGGDLTIGESGDYVLTGGLATIEKVIWDTVFTTKGERYWDPGRGTDLGQKRLRPLDPRASQRALERQVEGIPHVRAAVVQMLWDGAQQVISIKAQTDFGRLETSRGVDDGD